MGRPAGWMKELTGRSAMKSPGAPSLRREVERQFWRGVARGLSSEDAAVAIGASPAAGSRWFRERGGMPPLSLPRCPAGICRSPSVRRSHCCGRRTSASARSRGSWAGTGRRSRGSCAATPPPGAGGWSTGHRWRSGRRSCSRSVRSRRSSSPTPGCTPTSRSGLPVRSTARTAPLSRARSRSGGRAGTSRGGRTGGGPRRGVRSRSPTGCGSTSPTMGPCGSPMRRSTRPSTSRAAARSSASWWPACERDGHCGSPPLEPVGVPAAT